MIDTIISIILHPAFTAIIGFIVGHFWSLWRDRGKEFNSVATPINIALLKQLAVLKEELPAPADPYLFVSFDDFNLLDIHLPKRIAAKYKQDLEQYKKAAEHCGSLYGSIAFHIEDNVGVVVEGLDEYIKATEKMLSYVKRK